MNIDKSCDLFFGCKIDSKLREALAQAKPGDRKYFEDPDSEYLRILSMDGEEQWIGKVIKGGLTVTEVEDIQRNVISILRRIASGVRISPSSVKIFVVTSERSPAQEVSSSPRRDPYIVNYEP